MRECYLKAEFIDWSPWSKDTCQVVSWAWSWVHWAKWGRKEWGRHSAQRNLPGQGSGGVSQAILQRSSLHSKGQEMPGVSDEGLGSVLGALGSHERAESKGGTGLTLGPWNGLDGETGAGRYIFCSSFRNLEYLLIPSLLESLLSSKSYQKSLIIAVNSSLPVLSVFWGK